MAKDLSPLDRSPCDLLPNSMKSANLTNSSIQHSEVHDRETLYVEKTTRSRKRYQIIHKQNMSHESQDKKMFESIETTRLHQSTNQMINGSSPLRSEERIHDQMMQNEKEDEDDADDGDPHRNQNPMTLLGSQKSLHHVENRDGHFRLKGTVHSAESKGPAITRDAEEEDATRSPIQGFQARKTIILSSQDLPAMNLNQIPSPNTKQIPVHLNPNRASQPYSLPSSQKIYSDEQILKQNSAA